MKSLVALLVTLLALVGSSKPAEAITFGEPDGDRHPHVGCIVRIEAPANQPELEVPRSFCSATLIHPRVLLTAGHCTAAMEFFIDQGVTTLNAFRVSFSSGDAFDPDTWLEIESIITHPEFTSQHADWRDIGVVILKEPVVAIAPAVLAPPGFLDFLKHAGELRSGNDGTPFTAVGYGATLDRSPPTVTRGDGIRRSVESEFLALRPEWLVLSKNSATDSGGGGFGDSGGPRFWADPDTGEELLVAVTSWSDPELVALDMTYRIDIPQSFEFIAFVLALADAGLL